MNRALSRAVVRCLNPFTLSRNLLGGVMAGPLSVTSHLLRLVGDFSTQWGGSSF